MSTVSTTTGNDSQHQEATNIRSWRSLLDVTIAKTRKIRGSNYVQLATMDDGEPRCRSVVFRGFLKLPVEHEMFNSCDNLSCIMKMCTHAKSQKVSQYNTQPIAELVWWFPKTNEQYRIRGPLHMIGIDEADKTLASARKELWGNLSDPARESFFGSDVPGMEYLQPTTQPPPGGRDEDGTVLPPPENFLLMLLSPTDVDYLRLGSEQYRQIDCLSKDSGWSFLRVNP